MADIEDSKQEDDDAAIARLLKASGGRERPSESLQRHVRAAVHAEWRAAVAQRGRTRQRIWMAAAASVLALVAGLWVSQSRMAMPGALVASVSRMTGEVRSSPESSIAWLESARSSAVSSSRQMRAGETLQTGADGRVALAVAGNVFVRMDHDTRIAFIDAGRIEVRRGAIYVDAGTNPSATRPLLVQTPAGAVRHLGTQYEVRVLPAGTRIRVREGRVELADASGASEQVSAGEQLLVTVEGVHRRDVSAPQDKDWSWVNEVAPPFDIEGRPLSDFLDWVARETGTHLVFADPGSEAEAASAVLHGSIAGLRPEEALQAVLPTTRLRGRRLDGDLLIEMP